MKIASTGITYQRIPGGNSPAKSIDPKPKPTFEPKIQDSDSPEKNVAAVREDINVGEPLSSHLSNDEQMMLQQLFPTNGSRYAIRAYQKTFTEAHVKPSGTQLDITT